VLNEEDVSIFWQRILEIQEPGCSEIEIAIGDSKPQKRRKVEYKSSLLLLTRRSPDGRTRGFPNRS
jgi:hypothetical protein